MAAATSPSPSKRTPSVTDYHLPLAPQLLFRHPLRLFLFLPLFVIALSRTLRPQYDLLISSALRFHQLVSPVPAWLLLAAYSAPLLLVLVAYLAARRRPVYMLDFACFRPCNSWKVSLELFLGNSKLTGLFTDESLDFQKKILQRSGIGQETYFPPSVIAVPPYPCLFEARAEAEEVMFGALDELFLKTQVCLRDIGILIVNCSAFCPSPSLTSIIVNRYKLRGNLISYNLAGMGCSAGVLAVDLAKRLLTVHPRTYAVVLSTENITLNWYRGNYKTMLVSNCLFRVGGSACLLSNYRRDKSKSKYQLLHTVRTTKSRDDKCFHCVQQAEDPSGILGVILSRELMGVAASALRTNITTLGPLVLPLSELLLFFGTLMARQVLKKHVKQYIPDFSKVFRHFCIHAGGRAVLDEVEKSLNLSEWHMEPSRMTLFRFGNTSSSSVWYELAYLEAKGRVRPGDRVWQIGFGSGFKCNSAAWKALGLHRKNSVSNCWSEFIDDFPVEVSL